MRPPDPDRFLKRIWLINGVLLLALGGVMLGIRLANVARRSRVDARAAIAAGRGAAEARIRAVRFDAPQRLLGRRTQVVFLRNGAGFVPETSPAIRSSLAYERVSHTGPIVNVIFLPPEGAPGRLLFDRPAYIREIALPGRSHRATDSLQSWIAYEAAIDDSDGNGLLDEQDVRTLFISDLDGSNVRRVLPGGWRLQEHMTLGDRRSIFLLVLRGPAPGQRDWEERDAPQHALVYDVPSGVLRPHAMLDSLAARAGALLGGAGR